MNPSKVDRARLVRLTDLPNVGPATAEDLHLLGVRSPEDLVGRCPFELFTELCVKTGASQDPCVLDVFLSVTSFMNGGPALPWWRFTETRKAALAELAAGGIATGR